ncbi:hypothetical protein PAXRUDRAFT_309913 [Paxillus rubicundulus Ve08.2h10]|uniref:Uncharacterized protein n=1 Tax=Paxillus rubicundulus Ve08.2h10 TaxID=930991 RepID=A0A0D0DKM9_9AGAM|nr:hypothetical protein PAXRUDRAFT_309913 [Paxillus rubicundulus Ve08.2h10]
MSASMGRDEPGRYSLLADRTHSHLYQGLRKLVHKYSCQVGLLTRSSIAASQPLSQICSSTNRSWALAVTG